MPAHKGGKKNRKFGRNKVKCARYQAEGRREANKARKAASLTLNLAKARESRERLERIRNAMREAELQYWAEAI